MLAIRKILCPTDFSPNADSAFHLACALARDHGARMLLLHVKPIPTVAYGEFGVMPPEFPEEMETLRERLAALVPPASTIPFDHLVVEGDPAEEIVRQARSADADLIVLGTHGRTGLGRLLMGSIAELVVRRAHCPVLTVKNPLGLVTEEMAFAEAVSG